MINRKAFYEIFFYNKENPSRELLEMAESVWRAYMQKYGLGLDASASGEPTYEEVKEITYLANYAVEMVAAKEAAAAAPAAATAPEAPEEPEEPEKPEEPEEPFEEPAPEAQYPETEAPAEEAAEKVPAEAQEAAEEIIEETVEEPVPEEEEPILETEVLPQELPKEEVIRDEAPLEIPAEMKAVRKAPTTQKTAAKAGSVGDLSLWMEQLIHWCEDKGLLCIKTIDDGDCYLHVYLPYKKEVHPVGKWCFREDTTGADLAAEITKLYAYCTGYADCFEQLIK